jgi:hypothetical protein
MRFRAFPSLALLAGLALSLAGCAAPVPPAVGEGSGKTLLVRPFLVEGTLKTQGIVNPKTAADIASLEVVPYVHVGNDVYWPLSPQTGEATDSVDPDSILKARLEGFDPDRQSLIPLTGLRPQTRYRIVARAHDASASIISTEDARSYAEITVQNDDRPELPLNLPVTLVDTPFGATRTIAFQITGSPFFRVAATLYEVNGEQEVAVPNGTFSLTPEEASRPVSIANLEANTTYRLSVRVLNEAFGVMAGASHDLVITNNDDPLQETIPIAVP